MEPETNPQSAKNFFSPRTYDRLKFIAQILLPALGTLYFGLSEIWKFPYGPEVIGTITVVDLFLGAILGFSSAQYYKHGGNFDGEIQVIEGQEKDLAVLAPNKDPEELLNKHSVEFIVNRIKREQGDS